MDGLSGEPSADDGAALAVSAKVIEIESTYHSLVPLVPLLRQANHGPGEHQVFVQYQKYVHT